MFQGNVIDTRLSIQYNTDGWQKIVRSTSYSSSTHHSMRPDLAISYLCTGDAVRCQTLLRLQHGATSSAHAAWPHRSAWPHQYLHQNGSNSTQLNTSLMMEDIMRDTARGDRTKFHRLEKYSVGSKSLSQEVGSNSESDTKFLMGKTGESWAEREWSLQYESLRESPHSDPVLNPLSLAEETSTISPVPKAQGTDHGPMSLSSPASLSPPPPEALSVDLRGGDNDESPTESTPAQMSDIGQCEPCYCNRTNIVYVREKLPQVSSCNCNQQYQGQSSYFTPNSVDQNPNQTKSNSGSKVIVVITPTYKRATQKIDLTSMCYTLMHVPDLVWIVIEDATRPTDLVTRLLQRCKVRSVQLVVHTSSMYQVRKGRPSWSKPRGVEQRNAGLNWLRKHFSLSNCNGVFYFGDDDNKYDLRLFDEVSITCKYKQA